MEELKKNSLVIIICAILIGLTFLLVWLFSGEYDENDAYLRDPIFLRNYGVNEVIPVTITQEQMARIYLSEYVQMLMNDPRGAYELLDPEYRETAFPTFELFEQHIDMISGMNFSRAELVRFQVRNGNGYRIYDVRDAAGNNFIFQATSIMNYTVRLDNRRR